MFILGPYQGRQSQRFIFSTIIIINNLILASSSNQSKRKRRVTNLESPLPIHISSLPLFTNPTTYLHAGRTCLKSPYIVFCISVSSCSSWDGRGGSTRYIPMFSSQLIPQTSSELKNRAWLIAAPWGRTCTTASSSSSCSGSKIVINESVDDDARRGEDASVRLWKEREVMLSVCESRYARNGEVGVRISLFSLLSGRFANDKEKSKRGV